MIAYIVIFEILCGVVVGNGRMMGERYKFQVATKLALHNYGSLIIKP